jgi:hypothetical protein
VRSYAIEDSKTALGDVDGRIISGDAPVIALATANDGTLRCEKPMPIRLDFILRRLAEMVAEQPDLATNRKLVASS